MLSEPMAGVCPLRIRQVNSSAIHGEQKLVLYWMTAARRPHSNFALDRAIEHARTLGKPLVVLEALRVGYRWASDRHHAFVLQGMAANQRYFSRANVTYYPYVEPTPGDGAGLLEALATTAAVVVTDDYPCFFLPRMLEAAAARLRVRVEAIDGNGLLPLAATDRLFSRAVDLRRFLQKHLPEHLGAAPDPEPSRLTRKLPRLAKLPDRVTRRWPRAAAGLLEATESELGLLPIDHAVRPTEAVGGADAASELLARFVGDRLAAYADESHHPDLHATSELSPYLHFGHVGSHQILRAVAEHEGWSLDRVSTRSAGQKDGWWGMSASAEAFLDQLVTWRELGLNFCSRRPDYDRYDSLPQWARTTLEEHAADERPVVYSLAQLEAAETHDPIWNAAQRQLLGEGRIQGYLRMLWGKKILEWSPSPQEALDAMIELNNKYALDGRDPNSYSGIFWCLGRYDRPWAPKRPIFGTIRFMSSASAKKKLKLREYLKKWDAPTPRGQLAFGA